MKEIRLTLAFILLLFQANVFAQFGKKVVGNNKYTTIDQKVEGYKKLVVSNVRANVIYINNPDSVGFVKVYGEENIVHLLEFTVKNQSLKINYVNMANTEHGLLLIYVYSPQIEAIDLTGNVIFETAESLRKSNLSIALSGNCQTKIKNLVCDKLKVSLLTGSGDVLLKGKATEANYSVVGSGEIRAEDLVADQIKCKIVGNGNIGCHALKTIHVTIIGTGNVYYHGAAEPKSTIIGTGNLKHL